MGQKRKKHRINSHPINHCPMSEGVSEVSEQANKWAQRSAWVKRAGRSKQTTYWCERTNERTSKWPSGPVLQSGFLVILDHGVVAEKSWLPEYLARVGLSPAQPIRCFSISVFEGESHSCTSFFHALLFCYVHSQSCVYVTNAIICFPWFSP